MYIKKYININTILILLFLMILSVNISYQNAEAETREATTINHFDKYSDFHNEALLETEIMAQTFIDVLLDEAEKYGVYPKTEVKVDVNSLDLTDLSRFVSTVPEDMNLPITIVDEFRTYLIQYYQETYNTLISSYGTQKNQFSQESLVSQQGGRGENLYDISSQGMQKFLDSEKTTKLEEKNAEGFQSKTESLDSRKQNFPKMPKTTVPPPSEPHCMTAGVNKSGNPYEKNIDEIEEPPVQELENKDIKEELLYANEETNLNLRNILTESLEKNIEKELERYHKKKKNDKSSNFTDPLDEKANTLRDEAMITQNVLNAFVFSKNMEDLAKRHREWQSAIEKIEEVVLQIKDLENMKTDISEDRKNYQKMI